LGAFFGGGELCGFDAGFEFDFGRFFGGFELFFCGFELFLDPFSE
jgi:hypothetical protein